MNLLNSIKNWFFKEKKILFTTYFIFFILINILDFFGLLQGDIDFFKKILSWALIWMLFYKANFSNIFFGIHSKKINLIYITVFSLFTIPKLLKYYFSLGFTYNFFSIITNPLNYILSHTTALQLLFLPLLILIITNITILENITIKGGLLNDLNLKQTFFYKTKLHISLFFITLFFSLIIVPFFLEWFALSVDAVILVAGLVYYTYHFLSHHFYSKHQRKSKLLSTISNTGNNFFIFLVNSFSKKNTFFIGISFLLTLHLLVDTAIYLIPNLLGNFSQLYGNQISTTSLFNILSFKNSIFFQEFNLIQEYLPSLTSQMLYVFFALVIYLGYFSYFFILMVFPFYFIYTHIKNKKIILPKIISFTIIIFTFLSIIIILFLPDTQIPFQITKISGEIQGVDIKSQMFLKQNEDKSIILKDNILNYYSIIIIFIVTTLGFLLFRYEKYEIYFKELTYIIGLLFFLFYITNYYISINQENFQLFTDETITSYGHKDSLEINKGTQIGNAISITKNGITFNGRFYTNKLVEQTYFQGTIQHNGEIIDHFFPSEQIYSQNPKQVLSFIYGKEKEIPIKIVLKEEYTPEITSKQEHLELLNLLNVEPISLEKQRNGIDIFFKSLILFFSTIFYIIGSLVFTKHFIHAIKKEN
jgi:hypothetical protein